MCRRSRCGSRPTRDQRLARAFRDSAPRGARLPRRAVAAGLGVVVLIAVIALWAPWRGSSEVQLAGPAVIVLPFQSLSGGEGGQLLANGLTSGLVNNLMRFDGLQVFAICDDQRQRDALAKGGGRRAPAYVVTGSVERDPDRVRVTARLTDRASAQVLWSQSYDQVLIAAKRPRCPGRRSSRNREPPRSGLWRGEPRCRPPAGAGPT